MAPKEGWPALFWTAFRGSRNAMVLLDDHRRHVDVNGAYLKLLGYPREQLIGRQVSDFVAGGPRLSQRRWLATIGRGEFSGETSLVRADESTVTVQYAGHTEVVTGERRVLFVALSTSRWGRHSRRDTNDHPPETLSPREREIVRLVAAGETGPEIAEQLHIARDRAHARAQRHGEGRRPVASASGRQGTGRGPRAELTTPVSDRAIAVSTRPGGPPRMARPPNPPGG